MIYVIRILEQHKHANKVEKKHIKEIMRVRAENLEEVGSWIRRKYPDKPIAFRKISDLTFIQIKINRKLFHYLFVDEHSVRIVNPKEIPIETKKIETIPSDRGDTGRTSSEIKETMEHTT